MTLKCSKVGFSRSVVSPFKPFGNDAVYISHTFQLIRRNGKISKSYTRPSFNVCCFIFFLFLKLYFMENKNFSETLIVAREADRNIDSKNTIN